jgi:hypothetical protein
MGGFAEKWISKKDVWLKVRGGEAERDGCLKMMSD